MVCRPCHPRHEIFGTFCRIDGPFTLGVIVSDGQGRDSGSWEGRSGRLHVSKPPCRRSGAIDGHCGESTYRPPASPGALVALGIGTEVATRKRDRGSVGTHQVLTIRIARPFMRAGSKFETRSPLAVLGGRPRILVKAPKHTYRSLPACTSAVRCPPPNAFELGTKLSGLPKSNDCQNALGSGGI